MNCGIRPVAAERVQRTGTRDKPTAPLGVDPLPDWYDDWLLLRKVEEILSEESA